MQSLATHLLAVRDESGKLIFGALVFVIWVIGSIVSSIKKATDARKVLLEKQKMAATRAAMQLPAVPRAQPKWRQPAPPSRKVAKRRPPPIPKKAPAPPRREPEPILMQVAEPTINEQAASAPARARAAGATTTRQATAASLNRWLNPKTMRQQFILTELLQPPITLRENHLF